MPDKFKKFLGEHKFFESTQPTDEQLKYLSANFEEDYVSFIRQEGFSGYDNGLFWTVDPQAYEQVLKKFQLNPEVFKVVVRSAFADLILTNGVGIYFFYSAHQELYQFSSSLDNLFNLFLCTKKFLKGEMRGDDLKKMTPDLGLLNANECYAYEAETAKKTDIFAYLDTLS